MATIQEISAAYRDNADYEATNSLTKCAAFITACIQIIGLPSRAMESGSGTRAEHEFDVPTIREELQYARSWKSKVDTQSGATNYSSAIVQDVDFRPGAGRR